jgi:hypothetical protein
MKNMQWGYNINNYDVWQCSWFDSREEAIQAAKDEILENELDREEFQIGQLSKYEPSVYLDITIENAAEQAYDDCGEISESWLNFKYISKEVLEKYNAKLNTLFNEFLVEANEVPDFGQIINVEVIKVDEI